MWSKGRGTWKASKLPTLSKKTIKPLYTNKIIKSNKKGVSKYGNVPKGGCDSTAEYNRWVYLRQLEKAGLIKGLRKHVLYRFKKGAYEADFVYIENDQLIVEDVKHPVLLREFKFRQNRRKMSEEYNLYVYPIRPSKVKESRHLAVYRRFAKK